MQTMTRGLPTQAAQSCGLCICHWHTHTSGHCIKSKLAPDIFTRTLTVTVGARAAAKMSDKKPGHSGKLMQLRFMQRAVEKKKMEEAVERQAAAVDAEEETDAGAQVRAERDVCCC